jgi:diguanylate cyclase (GGDEF)-like protein/putative nucleotidyltransferase with HDIG domain
MSRRAWAHICAVLVAAAVLSGLAFTGLVQIRSHWMPFVVLTMLAITTQLMQAEAPGRQSYYPTMILLFAGVVLLHPSLFVLLVAIPHLVEWVKARLVNSPYLRDWYIQPFNIATHIISGFGAYWMYALLMPAPATFTTLRSVLAAAAAGLTYLLLNHYLIGQALVLARGLGWRESGVMDVENLLSDSVMLALGFVVAVLWNVNPWLVVPALLPVLLIYRALSVPRLKKEAATDDKTGLWNARQFTKLLNNEIQRARRFNRPLALIMADLDLLRNINNTYGHLAGDIVLETVGGIIRRNVRDYDIAARFGGEEFCVVLPEAHLADATAFAEKLRRAVEDARIEVKTSATPIRATMSLGIACFPADASSTPDLIQQADVAMYQAKLRGRNCVVPASELPQFVRARLLPSEVRSTEEDATASVSGPDGSDGEVVSESATQPAQDEAEDQAQFETAVRRYPKALLPLFIGCVIMLGVSVAVTGLALGPRPDLVTLGLFALLALMAEMFEVNIYGASTMSVSVGVAFAAALVSGFPGVASVSAAIALVHWLRVRPAAYKTAFNWATHVLAGAAPVLAMGLLDIPLQVSNLPLLVIPAGLAVLAYYAVDTGLIAVAISLSQGTSPGATWREQFRWLAEHYMVLCALGLLMGMAYVALGVAGLILFPLPVLMVHYVQKQYVKRTEQGVRELRRMNQELTMANQEILGANEAFRQLNDELFLTFAKIIEARDPYVSGHSAKVAEYATALADELDLPADDVRDIRQAAFLHDIGKIGVSELVLRRPGRLTGAELEQLRTHAALGAEFLETCQGLRDLAPMVRHHHERWDGAGYPDCVAGEEICLGARILAVCDAAEAMASDRSYRRAMSLGEILAEIKLCSGTQFDPAVVEAFVRFAARSGEEVVTNSAEHAGEAPAEVAESAGHGLEKAEAYLTA